MLVLICSNWTLFWILHFAHFYWKPCSQVYCSQQWLITWAILPEHGSLCHLKHLLQFKPIADVRNRDISIYLYVRHNILYEYNDRYEIFLQKNILEMTQSSWFYVFMESINLTFKNFLSYRCLWKNNILLGKLLWKNLCIMRLLWWVQILY